jgi:hypothetical protein
VLHAIIKASAVAGLAPTQSNMSATDRPLTDNIASKTPSLDGVLPSSDFFRGSLSKQIPAVCLF